MYFARIPVASHRENKEKLLELIDATNSHSIEGISKTDWPLNLGEQKYSQLFQETVHIAVGQALGAFQYTNTASVKNMWFQQYSEGDDHDWHYHMDVNWHIIYYLELPENSPGTELILPGSDLGLTANVNEGDILMLQPNIRHRSAKNSSSERKTIIGMNL